MMNKKTIYLDNASSTIIDPEVMKVLTREYENNYANSSSIHSLGQISASSIERNKNIIKNLLNAKDFNIYFTSGATESNNWAIIGYCTANLNKGKHVITTKIEHDSVLMPFKYLESIGFEVDYLNVDKNGYIDLEEFRSKIKDGTIFTSIIFVNNEIGTIQQIGDISKICKEKQVALHTDATQALYTQEINLDTLGVDMISFSAHKIHGPKGIGMLAVKNNIIISSLIMGGAQQSNMRAGTLSPSLISAFMKSLEIATINRKANVDYLAKLRKYTINKLNKKIDGIKFNGDKNNGAVNILSILLDKPIAKKVEIMLDMQNICVSTGSACSAGLSTLSHVLTELSKDECIAKSSIRISFSKFTTIEEIDLFYKTLEQVIKNC